MENFQTRYGKETYFFLINALSFYQWTRSSGHICLIFHELDLPLLNHKCSLTFFTINLWFMATKLVQQPIPASHVIPPKPRATKIIKTLRLFSATHPRTKSTIFGECISGFRPIYSTKVAEQSPGMVEDETLAQAKTELYQAIQGIPTWLLCFNLIGIIFIFIFYFFTVMNISEQFEVMFNMDCIQTSSKDWIEGYLDSHLQRNLRLKVWWSC